MGLIDDLQQFNDLNADIAEFLSDLGIKVEVLGPYGWSPKTVCAVDRTSMVQVVGGDAEEDAYDATLELVREQFADRCYPMWSGRNDDWMSFDYMTPPTR